MAQTKKKKKLGQFSGSKPSGLSPQRALLNLGRPCCRTLIKLKDVLNFCFNDPIKSLTLMIVKTVKLTFFLFIESTSTHNVYAYPCELSLSLGTRPMRSLGYLNYAQGLCRS
jgi:hypothetical protein